MASTTENYPELFKETNYPTELYTVEDYESIDDVPTQEVPAIILASKETKMTVKKCAHTTTPMPVSSPATTVPMPTTGMVNI